MAGLGAADRNDHIAIDIGIFATCNWLAHFLDATYIAQIYSRLVIDCNRRPGIPASMPESSDGVAVPGNLDLDIQERERRVVEIFRPYHDAIAAELDARAARSQPTVLCAMHSFTRQMDGFERPWDIGVIHGPPGDVANALLEALADSGLRLGRNEPYGVDFANDYTIPVHGDGHRSVEIEVCQDLIADDAGQRRLAAVLWPAFRRTAAALGLAGTGD